MLKTLLTLSLICAGPAIVQAKAFKLGDDEAVSWVSIPDTWEPQTIDDGVEGTSPDKETYVAAEIVDADDVAAAVKEEDKFFRKQKIKIKADTKKESKTTVNGLEAFDYSWDATDEDGPTHVGVTFVVVRPGKLLLLTYWGSEAGEKANGKELTDIAQSIKPIK